MNAMLLSDGTSLLMETQKKNITNITWKKNIIFVFIPAILSHDLIQLTIKHARNKIRY